MDDPHGIQRDLFKCVEDGNIDAVRWLIEEAGADVNHVWDGVNGRCALGLAIYGDNTHPPSLDMVNELLALGADANADVHILFGAILAVDGGANPDLVATLIAAGADVQVKRYQLQTPLHAVSFIHDPKKAVAVAKLLISKGALVDAKDDRGERPLDNAISDFNFHLSSDFPCLAAKKLACDRALAKCLLRAGASTTGCRFASSEFPAKTLVELVVKRGGWKKYALWHKRVLAGLVSKCSKRVDLSDDAAGLVVDFYCPSGGS